MQQRLRRLIRVRIACRAGKQALQLVIAIIILLHAAGIALAIAGVSLRRRPNAG